MARFYEIRYLSTVLSRQAQTAFVADEQEIDRILGAVLQYADSSFNPLLELGFSSAIRREWAWRVSRGESLANLKAFEHLMDFKVF